MFDTIQLQWHRAVLFRVTILTNQSECNQVVIFYGRFGRKSRNCWHFNVCFGAKLDSQNSRLSVEFKPSKRMKKRRELDALVNGSKQPSGARVKNGRHELLRNESESSEVEEFSLTHNTAARKWVVYCCEGCPWLGSFSVNLYSDPSLPPDTTIRGAVHLAETSAVFIPYHCAIYGKTRLSFEYIGSVEKAGRRGAAGLLQWHWYKLVPQGNWNFRSRVLSLPGAKVP